jgi:hypothetical protein
MAFNRARAKQVLDRLNYIDSVRVPSGDPQNVLRGLYEERKYLVAEARGLLAAAIEEESESLR